MDSSGCPLWIDPGRAFRLDVKVSKYVADGEYGRDEHFEQLIKDRWNDKVAVLAVDVVNKYGQNANPSSGVTSAEGSAAVGNAQGSSVFDNVEDNADTYSSPPPYVPVEVEEDVDWAELTILVEPDDDGDAKKAADEDTVYEAMSFKAADERADEAARESVPIPTMTAEMQSDMAEAGVPVDDNVDDEPLFDWDRDNPDMSVSVCYPSVPDFRLAVRQHAIVNEFELETPHSKNQSSSG
ncbi:unnamed protein product [Urochloa decumbens]|uniref:Uncharacterized protein n=1 Tax=Urochloa decumbens TaxID=240449 RepID=A0ABC9HDK9_9POAL